MRSLILTAFLTLVAATSASAQPPVQITTGPDTPAVEFGVHLNLLELFGDMTRTFGGRVAKRHENWLVTELAYDRTSWTYENRESRVVVGALRIQSPYARMGKRPFASIGVAAADGMTFSWSPVVATGVQHETPGGAGVFRFEMQWFLRARHQPPWDRARLLVGVAVGIPAP